MKCAIYTRKSSEEGLEQDFNSLAAQREACEAYITSQRGQGWRALKTHYDDGGFSGGNLERPGLQHLLEDIGHGRMQVVVVYKIDRLTRSLADFAKLVEQFDTHGVSIVAVTQPFNTTTSMGRLTLNVLLSFAQFEREITGERIRDKIAASKQKGLWMGGVVPLGYDVQDRKLILNPREAETVRHVFQRYLALGSVLLLKEELDRDGHVSKCRQDRNGHATGGRSFSRGALYTLLRNPLYVGKIRHGDRLYDGQHPPLIDPALYDEAQTLLDAQQVRCGAGRASHSLLAGLLFDGDGQRMSPAHTQRHQQRYRYYVSQQVLHGGRSKTLARVPAHEIESAVIDALRTLLQDEHPFLTLWEEPTPAEVTHLRQVLRDEAGKLDDPGTRPARIRDILDRVDLTDTALRLTLNLNALLQSAGWRGPRQHTFAVTVAITRCQHGKKVVLQAASRPREPDSRLVAALAQAHQWHEALLDSEVGGFKELGQQLGVEHNYLRRIHQLVFLAPDIQLALLEGRQPAGLTLDRLTKPARIPPSFHDQRKLFGFEGASAGDAG
ncbi:MAG: recombinase family protein [Pseudomonadales bacterium]